MSKRSTVLVLIGAVASCFLLLLCVGLLGGGYYFLSNGSLPIAALGAPAELNRIAFVGNDLNIYVTNPVDGTKTALTTDGGSDHAYNYSHMGA